MRKALRRTTEVLMAITPTQWMALLWFVVGCIDRAQNVIAAHSLTHDIVVILGSGLLMLRAYLEKHEQQSPPKQETPGA